MHKIQPFFKHIIRTISGTKINTPTAVLIGSVIIALSIVSYGYIVRPAAGSGAGQATVDFVKVIAKELKLKGSAWESCLASPEITAQIEREQNDGVSAGVTGTPSSFILLNKNGVYETVARIEGAQPESVIREAIDQALSGNAKTIPFNGQQPTEDELINGTKGGVLFLEYADAECPFCVRFHPTVTSVMNAYDGKIGFTYRHFPLAQIHPNAIPYAKAIECAGKLKGSDAYFGFIDKLFAKQAQNY